MRIAKKLKYVLVVSGIIGAMALVGCSSAGSEQAKQPTNQVDLEITQSIEHTLGTTEVALEVNNIAVLELSYLDSLYHLGQTPIAIADDDRMDKVTDITSGEVSNYISVGKRAEPSLEELSLLDLDLIIADTTRHSEIYNDLSKLAPTIVLNSIDSSYDDYIYNLRLLAQITNQSMLAEELIAHTEMALSEISQIVTERYQDQEVLVVSPKNDKYTAHTNSSFVGQLLAKAGFTNAVQAQEKEVSLSLEQLIEINPDHIIYMRDDIDTTIYTEWKDTALYKGLDAVQADQVYTTTGKEYWTQYRGLTSIEFILNEVYGWLIQQ